MKHAFYILLLLSGTLFAQEKRVKTHIDTTSAKIGAQVNLTLFVSVDTLSKVNFPDGLYLGAMEVLEDYPADTLREDFRYHLIKKYGLTQWDSGSYLIPNLPVFINDKIHFSDSLRIQINPIEVDTLKQPLYDIKEVTASAGERPLWIIFIYSAWLVLLIIAIVTVLIYKKYKRKKQLPVEEILFDSPIEKATVHLEQLKTKNYILNDNVKEYYSELTDIARTYIEESLEIPAMESTTHELITEFKKAVNEKKIPLSNDVINDFKRVLEQADLVKFAKSKPLSFEIDEDTKKIEKTIVTLHQSTPDIPEEEQVIDKEQKELIKKLRRKQKRVLAALSIFLAILIVNVVLILSVGWNNYQNFLFGNETKKLLEGEWIDSEYGYPPVLISTPKPLMRVTHTDEPLFLDGNYESFFFMTGNNTLRIELQTVLLPEPQKAVPPQTINLEKMLEDVLADLEKKQNASRIIVKTDLYDNDGFQGIKAYGSLKIPNPKKENQLLDFDYQVILIGQDKGIQRVFILNRSQDEFAEPVSNRIFESIEFKKAN